MNPELNSITTSTDLFAALQRIETALSLHIDQTGELYVIISDIITEKDSSQNFIKNVMEHLNVNRDLAQKIAEMTDKEIFQVIKNNLQKSTEIQQQSAAIQHIERVGGFSVEKEQVATPTKVTPEDRSQILEHLEYPPGVPKTTSNDHVEPLVDHLLSNPVSQPAPTHTSALPPVNLPVSDIVMTTPAQKPTDTTPAQPKPPIAPAQPKPQPRVGADPYRETV